MTNTELRQLLDRSGVTLERLHGLLGRAHPDDPVELRTVRSWTTRGRRPPARWAPRIERLLLEPRA